ncbi:hypothetical protein PCANC_06179 [Puccinia coronata f. sp. avenae]|uniref:Uncharacterized protein n=1 Tax=Puccinia coronata f. sp. avenae TaxID=200324 RepID=A0A2N5VTF0_9BASI|nr:hypothetical protein PCANC_06179 [Puccinia coronata f. sp. avenae]
MTHANSSNYDPSPSLPSEVASRGMSPTPTPCDAQSTSNYPSTSCSAASSLLSTDDHPPTPLNLCLLTPVKPHPHSTARNDTFDADRSALTSLHPHQTTSYCKSQPSAEPIGTLASSSNASLSGVAFSLNDDTEGVTHGHIQLSANDRDMGMLEGCGGDEDVGLTQETDPHKHPKTTEPSCAHLHVGPLAEVTDAYTGSQGGWKLPRAWASGSNPGYRPTLTHAATDPSVPKSHNSLHAKKVDKKNGKENQSTNSKERNYPRPCIRRTRGALNPSSSVPATRGALRI